MDVLSNYLQDMLLLKAILKEWDSIAQMYCNGMQMANVTFIGVWDAILAEFEQTACPAQLAHHADRISVVKRKGQSPCFNEQRKQNSAPCLAPDTPHQNESSKKRTRKGGKQEKAHRAAHIVSSAFVPTAVLNCMQESHHQASTSHIEEVPVEPTPAPGFTMVGGPSQASAQSAAPATIASFKPLGITYSKAVQQPPQSIAGLSSNKAPFNMEKEHKLLKKVGVRHTVEPLRAMHKIVEEQDDVMDKVLVLHFHHTLLLLHLTSIMIT